MGYHSFPYFAAKFSFNELEKIWLENALEKLNVELGHCTKEENDLYIKEQIKDKEIIIPEKKDGYQEPSYFLDDYKQKSYLRDLERNFTINLIEESFKTKGELVTRQGIYYSTYNDPGNDIDLETIKKICQMLHQFLIEFSRSDVIKCLGYITNNRDACEADDLLFIGARVSKEKIEILDLLEWIFNNEMVDLLPDYNNVHNY